MIEPVVNGRSAASDIVYFRSVPRAEVDALWPSVRTLLEPAIARWRGRVTADDLLASLRAANAQLWVVQQPDGRVTTAALSEIAEWPQFKECVITLAGGTGYGLWRSWMRDGIKPWAESLGCQIISVRGRKGWERILGPLGFETDSILLTLEL